MPVSHQPHCKGVAAVTVVARDAAIVKIDVPPPRRAGGSARPIPKILQVHIRECHFVYRRFLFVFCTTMIDQGSQFVSSRHPPLTATLLLRLIKSKCFDGPHATRAIFPLLPDTATGPSQVTPLFVNRITFNNKNGRYRWRGYNWRSQHRRNWR